MRIKNDLSKLNNSFDEIGVISEYENKGLSLVEEKIYSKYLSKTEARILDIGCFVGRVSFPLANKGFRVFGIDISLSAIKRANELKKNKDNVNFKIASATNIPFKDETFDYILFPYNTIEGIPSQQSRINAMKEATRSLKQNGLILFSAHNRLYPKYCVGITINELYKLLLKVLVIFRLDSVLPSKMKKIIRENINTEFASILWVEPGGSNFVKWHFSTSKEIKEILKSSSLRLVEKVPVMDHGPQKIHADLLRNSRFNFLKAPVFYYICEKATSLREIPRVVSEQF